MYTFCGNLLIPKNHQSDTRTENRREERGVGVEEEESGGKGVRKRLEEGEGEGGKMGEGV